jgi:hypothetical protein
MTLDYLYSAILVEEDVDDRPWRYKVKLQMLILKIYISYYYI